MDNIKAALLGVAIGDALGATVEFLTRNEIKRKYGVHQEIIGGGWLSLKPGETTDDTAMTLCVARGVVADPENPRRHIGEEFVKWYQSGPKDIGITCRAAIEEYIRSGQWQDDIHREDQEYQAGNGALMRCIYPALFYSNHQIALTVAREQGAMTHYSQKSADIINLYVTMVHNVIGIEGRGRRSAQVTNIIWNSAYKEIALWTRLPYGVTPSGYVEDSFMVATWHITNASSFEEAIVRVVNEGGDADTIGAISGGLAGAIWGMEYIPERWIKALDPAVREEIDYLAEMAAINRFRDLAQKGRWKMTTLGRPFKGKGRRIQTTIYADSKMLEEIEKYALERQQAGEKSYSRSEFYHEAAVAKLRELGRWPEEAEPQNLDCNLTAIEVKINKNS